MDEVCARLLSELKCSAIIKDYTLERLCIKNLESSLNWNKVPQTDRHAVITSRSQVFNVLAIEVKYATLRLAKIKDSAFEVADVVNPIRIVDGKLRVQVKCSWYGKRAKRSDT